MLNLRSPFRSELLTATFWRDVLARAARQGLQTLLPVLLAASTAGGLQRISYGAVGLVLAGAVAVTVLRALVDLRAPADAGFAEQLIDRATAAFAGSLIGVVTASQADLLHVDWGLALSLAGASALTSMGHLVMDALSIPELPVGPTPPPSPAGPPADDLTPVDTIDYPSDGFND